MEKYCFGNKVKTTKDWNNGHGLFIPNGSIVTVLFDNGNMCRCDFQGEEVWYEYESLGEILEN